MNPKVRIASDPQNYIEVLDTLVLMAWEQIWFLVLRSCTVACRVDALFFVAVRKYHNMQAVTEKSIYDVPLIMELFMVIHSHTARWSAWIDNDVDSAWHLTRMFGKSSSQTLDRLLSVTIFLQSFSGTTVYTFCCLFNILAECIWNCKLFVIRSGRRSNSSIFAYH